MMQNPHFGHFSILNFGSSGDGIDGPTGGSGGGSFMSDSDAFNFGFQFGSSERQTYIHGSHRTERARLKRQNDIFGEMIHTSLNFGKVKNLLEIGSGSGEQTLRLLSKYPDMHIYCVEIDPKQITAARKSLRDQGLLDRVTFIKKDARELHTLPKNLCDAAFVCFTLEHIANPERALKSFHHVLSPGSRLVFREVNNKSLQVHPEELCRNALEFWSKMAKVQEELGGDANIGFKLGSLLHKTGYEILKDKPQAIKLDKHNPRLLKELLEFWHDLMEGANKLLISRNEVGNKHFLKVQDELRVLHAHADTIFGISYQVVQARIPINN